MTERADGTNREAVRPTTRRRLLAAGSGLVAGLAGCSARGRDGDGTTEESGERGGTAGPGATEGPNIDHPDSVRFDEPFSVAVEGLSPGPVEVSLSVADHVGREWTARATYEATGGRLDLSETAPRDRDVGPGGTALLQRATTASASAAFHPGTGTPGTVRIDVRRDGERVASSTMERTYGGPELTSRAVESDAFVGTVYEPPGEESVPGLVALHGSGGRPAHTVARLLAANGYVVVALQYFDWAAGDGLLPNELVEVPVEFVDAAARWLLDHERTTGERVGVWGVSKGGELALLSASRFDAVGPVASVVGSGRVWQGLARTAGEPASSWTHGGEPVPYVPFVTDREAWDRTAPRRLAPGYAASLDAAAEDERSEAAIAVGDVDAPVVLVSGGADAMWPSPRLQRPAAERARAADLAVEHRVYGDAGHAIRVPYRPAANRRESERFVYGGTTAGYAAADADHWPRVLEAFETLR